MTWPTYVGNCGGAQQNATVLLNEIIQRATQLGPAWDSIRLHAQACLSNVNHGQHGQQNDDQDRHEDVCAAHTEIMKPAPIRSTVFNEITHSVGGGL